MHNKALEAGELTRRLEGMDSNSFGSFPISIRGYKTLSSVWVSLPPSSETPLAKGSGMVESMIYCDVSLPSRRIYANVGRLSRNNMEETVIKIDGSKI
jgi:hypothetical protein